MEIKLLPCPFCGGEARAKKKYFNSESVVTIAYRVVCRKCGAGSEYTDKEYAITAWNTRKPMERIVERLEERQDNWDSNYNESKRCGDIRRMDYSNGYADGVVIAIEIVKEEGAV